MVNSLLQTNNAFHGDETPVKILVVDDEPSIITVLVFWMRAEGYSCDFASNAFDAWEKLQQGAFTLLISDITMPGMSGMELLQQARAADPELAVIMVTGVDDRSVAYQALQLGAFGYIIKPFDQNEVIIQVANALERRKLECLSNAYERTLEERIRERTAALRQREAEITMRLVAASEFRDSDTGLHLHRMACYAETIANMLGWSSTDIDDLRLAAPMHDIGKIGIPDHILRKPGKLTDEEFAIMRTHTEIGAEIIGNSDIPLLQMARDITRNHHERWDGQGYLHGLSGDAIPESARIVAFADVYDALTSDRVYRPAFSEEETQAMMQSENGRQFDPQILHASPKLFASLREVKLEMESPKRSCTK